MALHETERYARASTGTLLSALASAYVCLFVSGVIGDQLEAGRAILVVLLVVAPLAAWALIGFLIRADGVRDYFAADRSVSAYYSGTTLASFSKASSTPPLLMALGF